MRYPHEPLMPPRPFSAARFLPKGSALPTAILAVALLAFVLLASHAS